MDGSSVSPLEEARQMNLAAVQAHITHEKDTYSEVRVKPTQKRTLLKLTLNEIRAALHALTVPPSLTSVITQTGGQPS